MPHTNQMTPEISECIQNCLHCHAICKETIVHCLMMGGKHSAIEHQKLLADCAQACIVSADFMLRMSDYHPHFCRVCADICKACAASCERLGQGDETMRKCADMCRRCAESCRNMAVALV